MVRGGSDARPAAGRPAAPRILPVGDLAILVEPADLDAVLATAAALRRLRLPGVVDIVPAARTVLVRCAERAAVRRVAAAVAGADPADDPSAGTEREVVIDVVYDGADLAAVGELTGLGAGGVVAAHSGTAWRAAFGGFAPGFVYLAGGDGRLEVPRLDSPRTAVPAGSVAIAGGFSAVYPGESPGGWRLLGRTGQRMWDETRDPPALVAPGDTVRFRAVRESLEVRRAAPGDAEAAGERRATEDAAATAEPEGPPRWAGPSEPVLTVVDPGMLTLVQDAGRPGRAAVGVAESGALDRAALRRANRAVGNRPGAAALENLNGGLALRTRRPLLVAVTGTDAEVRVEEFRSSTIHSMPVGNPFELLPGETLRLGAPSSGLRCYVAVRGGVAGRAVLGSLSHDSLSGLGPAPLRAGDRLPVGPEPDGGARQVPEPRRHGGAVVLRFVPGPRDDWFTAESTASFVSRAWRVTPRSNRVGLRLDGAPLERERPGELPTEGMVRGSVQVPPDGLPVLFLADHPVTGGYPVIGTVIDADLDRAAQLRPGAEVRFAQVAPDDPGPDRGAAVTAPERVSFSLEVDGRRYGVTVPGPLAAALEERLSDPDDTRLAAALAPIVAACEARGPDAPER